MSAHLRRTLERHATWPAVVVWALVIFGLSSIPNNFEPSESLIPADKIAHAIEFAVLALLATWAFARWRHADVVFAHAAVGFVLASAYGVTDEIHQHFVPGRDVTLGDFLADVAGAAFGAVTAFSLGKNRLAAR